MVEQRLATIIKDHETTMECGYYHDDPSKNHTVSLADIVPDLLLQELIQISSWMLRRSTIKRTILHCLVREAMERYTEADARENL